MRLRNGVFRALAWGAAVLACWSTTEAAVIYNAGDVVSWQGYDWEVVYGTATLQTSGDLTLNTGSTGVSGDNQGLIRLAQSNGNLPGGVTEASYSFSQQSGRVGMFVNLGNDTDNPRFELGSIFNPLPFVGWGSEALSYRTDDLSLDRYFSYLTAQGNSVPKSFTASFDNGILTASTTNATGSYQEFVPLFFQPYRNDDFTSIQIRVRGGSGSGSVTLTSFETNAAPVPEPTSFALLGFGLGGLCLRRLRNRRQLPA